MISIGKTPLAQVFIGQKTVSKIYLGNKLIFDGEQWKFALFTLDSHYLRSSDGFILIPHQEANV